MLIFASGVNAENVFAVRRTQTVTIAALDLQSEEGRNAAYSSLRKAAKNVCVEVEGRRTLDNSLSYARCVEDSLSAALVQVRDPVFQEFVARRAKEQRKTTIAALK